MHVASLVCFFLYMYIYISLSFFFFLVKSLSWSQYKLIKANGLWAQMGSLWDMNGVVDVVLGSSFVGSLTYEKKRENRYSSKRNLVFSIGSLVLIVCPVFLHLHIYFSTTAVYLYSYSFIVAYNSSACTHTHRCVVEWTPTVSS